MAAPAMFRWTDLSLTLGRWGQAPLTLDTRRLAVRTLANWSARTKQPVAVELYAGTEDDWTLLREVMAAGGLTPVVRGGYKTGWLAKVADVLSSRESESTPPFDPIKEQNAPGLQTGDEKWQEVTPTGPASAQSKPALVQTRGRVVIDVPVSPQAGAVRWLPDGVQRAPEFAARVARDAALAGLDVELALVDIARANKDDVQWVVDQVREAVRPHGMTPFWRFVDSSGAADPIGGTALPDVLFRWVPWLHYEFDISPDRVAVQAADTMGLALANVLAGHRAGAAVAAPLFGTGIGAGWAAAEVVIAHVLGDEGRLKKLLGLRELLAGESRDESRPVSGARVWQFAGGAAPEKPRAALLEASFPVDPSGLTGQDPEPVLTSLSGHAGLLHLMHRCWPERHFETDDQRALAISAAFEAEFAAGRQEPVSWRELKPKVLAAGILGDVESEQ